jgi:hypothetical protein
MTILITGAGSGLGEGAAVCDLCVLERRTGIFFEMLRWKR